MKQILFVLLVLFVFINSGCSQNSKSAPLNQTKKSSPKIGGGCDGCEAIYENPVPFEKLNWIDTLPDFDEPGPKMVISGVIYHVDGKTPAPNVVLYVYHTDQTGQYTPRSSQTGPGRRHGYIRGWMKTNEKGQYKFYTLKPAAYPGHQIPAHIHPIVKEPNSNEYYIDEYRFDDDPLLTTAERRKEEGRGGSGIIALTKENGMLIGQRDIFLGKNIPGYPPAKISGVQSGLGLGDMCPAFGPLHLSGADKGTHACPMCKYGYGQGLMVWFNHTSLDTFKYFIGRLEHEMAQQGEKKLRVFFVYMNPAYHMNDKTEQKILQEKIEKWCKEQNLRRVAVLWVPSPVDAESSVLFKINPSNEVKNTVMVYKKRKIAAKWVNIDYNDASLNSILLQF